MSAIPELEFMRQWGRTLDRKARSEFNDALKARKEPIGEGFSSPFHFNLHPRNLVLLPFFDALRDAGLSPGAFLDSQYGVGIGAGVAHVSYLTNASVWLEHGRVSWRLSKALASALANTEPPVEETHVAFSEAPLPIVWVQAGDEGGMFLMDANKIPALLSDPDSDTLEQHEGLPFSWFPVSLQGIGDPDRRFRRIALNLMWGLYTRHLVAPLVIPRHPITRVRRVSMKDVRPKMVRIALAPTTRSLEAYSQQGVGPRTTTIVRGHWRSVWVLDPGERVSLETKTREGRAPLHRVSCWIQPYRTGV